MTFIKFVLKEQTYPDLNLNKTQAISPLVMYGIFTASPSHYWSDWKPVLIIGYYGYWQATYYVLSSSL